MSRRRPLKNKNKNHPASGCGCAPTASAGGLPRPGAGGVETPGDGADGRGLLGPAPGPSIGPLGGFVGALGPWGWFFFFQKPGPGECQDVRKERRGGFFFRQALWNQPLLQGKRSKGEMYERIVRPFTANAHMFPGWSTACPEMTCILSQVA